MGHETLCRFGAYGVRGKKTAGGKKENKPTRVPCYEVFLNGLNPCFIKLAVGKNRGFGK